MRMQETALAQLRVADLQRKKEDIERQLRLISQQMQHNLHSSAQPAEFPPAHQHDRTYTTTLHNNNNNKNNCSSSNDGTRMIYSRNSSMDTLASVLEEGDSLFFQGRTFHYIDEHNVQEVEVNVGVTENNNHKNNNNDNSTTMSTSNTDRSTRNSNTSVEAAEAAVAAVEAAASNPYQYQSHPSPQRRRNSGEHTRPRRRFSLELAEPDSDEYILKELDEIMDDTPAGSVAAGAGPGAAVGAGAGATSSNTTIPSAAASSSMLNRVSLYEGSSGSNNTINSNPNNNNIEAMTGGGTAMDVSTTTNTLPVYLNLDRPNRRFSLTSTSVEDPFETTNFRHLYPPLPPPPPE
jgi:hypothetical protein